MENNMTRRVNHSRTICCVCGSDETYIRDDNPVWMKYPNSSKWDGKSYACNKCYCYTNRYGFSTKEEIGETRYEYNKRKKDLLLEGRMCCKCGSTRTYVSSSGSHDWRRCECGEENCTRWLCKNCSSREYQMSADSQNNMKRVMRDIRLGQLDRYSTDGQGIIGEAVVQAVDRLENRNLESDNFRAEYDLYNPEYKTRFQVKTPSLDKDKKWHINLGMEHNFDILIIICINGRCVGGVYKVLGSEQELYGETYINIYEDWSNVSKGGSRFAWVEKYKIVERSYNEAFNSLMTFLGDKKYIGVEDIKKWLVFYQGTLKQSNKEG
jgi:hypothetical protein